jgi:hypothetical protein
MGGWVYLDPISLLRFPYLYESDHTICLDITVLSGFINPVCLLWAGLSGSLSVYHAPMRFITSLK